MGRVAISIAGTGEGLAAPMDGRFGRAERFLVVDLETDEVLRTADNEARNASHGAGPRSASLMGELGATAVISGRFGPKAADALNALGLQTWIAPPGLTAGEALALLRDGQLERGTVQVFR